MLYWCASANDWDIVMDWSGVERPVRLDGPERNAETRCMTGFAAMGKDKAPRGFCA